MPPTKDAWEVETSKEEVGFLNSEALCVLVPLCLISNNPHFPRTLLHVCFQKYPVKEYESIHYIQPLLPLFTLGGSRHKVHAPSIFIA